MLNYHDCRLHQYYDFNHDSLSSLYMKFSNSPGAGLAEHPTRGLLWDITGPPEDSSADDATDKVWGDVLDHPPTNDDLLLVPEAAAVELPEGASMVGTSSVHFGGGNGHAKTCITVNGHTRCEGSSGKEGGHSLNCVTINGETKCESHKEVKPEA
jgi:hypothetical protein